MIRIRSHEDVTLYKMGRSIGPWVFYWTHAFLLNEVLVDTGTTACGRAFLKALGQKRVTAIVNTHHHEDHIGNNNLLQKHFNCPIYAHHKGVPLIAAPRRYPLRLYQHLVWKRAAPSVVAAVPPTVNTGGHTLSVIHVKGHTPDHICLYDAGRRWLFAGDMFCGVKNIYLRQDENFHQQLASLRHLAELPVDTLFCALKGVVRNGGDAIRQKIAFMENLQEKVWRRHDRGERPAVIRNRLFGREDGMYYLTAGHFAKINLITSILKARRDDAAGGEWAARHEASG